MCHQLASIYDYDVMKWGGPILAPDHANNHHSPPFPMLIYLKALTARQRFLHENHFNFTIPHSSSFFLLPSKSPESHILFINVSHLSRRIRMCIQICDGFYVARENLWVIYAMSISILQHKHKMFHTHSQK